MTGRQPLPSSPPPAIETPLARPVSGRENGTIMKRFASIACLSIVVALPSWAMADEDAIPSLAPAGEVEPPTAPLDLGGLPPEGDFATAPPVPPPTAAKSVNDPLPLSPLVEEPKVADTQKEAAKKKQEQVEMEQQALLASQKKEAEEKVDEVRQKEDRRKKEEDLARSQESRPEPAPAAAIESETVARAPRDLRVPRYTSELPHWAVEVTAALKAVGTSSRFPNGFISEKDVAVRGFSVQGDYQPGFFQQFGVLGFGPSLNWYPIFSPNALTADNRFGLWSAGGQIRYQAKFFQQQIFVPEAGVSAEMWQYHLATGPSGHLSAVGGFLGGMLLLNRLDPGGSASFYSNYGVLRSYLVAELRALSGSDANLTLSGTTYFFGLRIEF